MPKTRLWSRKWAQEVELCLITESVIIMVLTSEEVNLRTVSSFQILYIHIYDTAHVQEQEELCTSLKRGFHEEMHVNSPVD